MPEDLKHADPHTERRRILLRAFRKMIVGTALVLVFSDPIVSVMNEMGKRTGIPAFTFHLRWRRWQAMRRR